MYALPYLILIRLHRLALDARRRDRTWRYYAYSVAAGVLAGVLFSLALAAAWLMVQVKLWYLGVAMIVLFVLPPLQPVISRRILVPLGMVRTSFWLAHFVSMDDSDAYGLVCAAWAHSHKPTPRSEAWIIARRDKRVPLGDAEIIVTALLASARGDADTTRQLMRSTAEMVENHPLVRELAGEWLAVDAVQRFAWRELYDDSIAARWPASSLTFFLEGVAAHKLEAAGAPSRFEVRMRWLLAPHRGSTLRVLDAIKPAPPATKSGTPQSDPLAMPPSTIPPAAALPRALAEHLELSTIRPVNSERLANAVIAWDAALLDGETQKWLAQRALELDAPLGAVDRAIRDVATAVTDELARIAEASSLAAPMAHGPVGDALARRLRHGRLDALEAGFTRWEDRRHSGAVRAPIDEWREWVALRAAYDAAVGAGGLELRRLAFPHAYSKGTSMAVWLWNTRNEYALSHAISKWLLGEALTVGDTEAIELCSRNVRLTVPTRTGEVTTK
ncbi:MAG TPA: hypothetical protein VIV11_34270 [Kofleriaceae bacterium]